MRPVGETSIRLGRVLSTLLVSVEFLLKVLGSPGRLESIGGTWTSWLGLPMVAPPHSGGNILHVSRNNASGVLLS